MTYFFYRCKVRTIKKENKGGKMKIVEETIGKKKEKIKGMICIKCPSCGLEFWYSSVKSNWCRLWAECPKCEKRLSKTVTGLRKYKIQATKKK